MKLTGWLEEERWKENTKGEKVTGPKTHGSP